MFSIEEARAAHTQASYNVPFAIRRDCGSESIIRELEAEAIAVHRARMGKLRKAMMELYRRAMGHRSERETEQPAARNAALGVGN
jgi:hypothetical protein